MKQTNEQRIAKLEQEVDNLKSIILQLQSKLLLQDATITPSTTTKPNKKQFSKEELEIDREIFDPNNINLSLYTTQDVAKMSEEDKTTLKERIKALNPLMREMFKMYTKEKKLGKID